MVSKERIEWTVLGRVVGTGTGWDLADTFAMQVYDFEPAVGIDLPASEFMLFDFEKGVAETFDEDGKVTSSSDLVRVLSGVA
jgi:hypothetical protein